ncbi:hypothetical protein EC988_000462 [Linderina pennispora]|nr:hypothetical protein EC988_000462 [Linderina pennispora]
MDIEEKNTNSATLSEIAQGIEPRDVNLEQVPPKQLYSAIAALNALVFIGALDGTIINSIYVEIGSKFDALDRAIWVVTTYLLASTSAMAIAGRTSDIIGRMETTCIGIVVFFVGSILCAVSQSMNMLLASRTIQGIGGGVVQSLSTVILGDLVSERERGKYASIFSATWAIASAIGPVMGGGIVEHASWRIVFWINIPICVVCFMLVTWAIKLPTPHGTFSEKIRRVDFIGNALFLAGTIPVLLALSWGGQEYKWTSATVLACLVGGSIVLGAFVVFEALFATLPTIPVRLFTHRNVFGASFAATAHGAVMFSVILAVPIWEMAIKHASPINASLHVLPYMAGTIVFAPVTGIYLSKIGWVRPVVRVGSVLAAAGACLLLLLNWKSSMGQRVGFIFTCGCGGGFLIQSLILVAQASVAGKDMAVVASSITFLRSFGGVLSSSLGNSIMNSQIRSKIGMVFALYPDSAQIVADSLHDQALMFSSEMPVDVRDRLIRIWSESIHSSFFPLIAYSAILVSSCFIIKHVELMQERKKTIS